MRGGGTKCFAEHGAEGAGAVVGQCHGDLGDGVAVGEVFDRGQQSGLLAPY